MRDIDRYIKCEKCLVNYHHALKHTCDPLMKELVKMKKEQIMWALVDLVDKELGWITAVYSTRAIANIVKHEYARAQDCKIVKVKVTIL